MNRRTPVLSVVIPVYNGEKYIDKCLNSIRNQGSISIEVVAVNDGSTDGSLECLEKWTRKCEQNISMVIVNQENAGQGQARNKGIQNASGEYITFLDQDDTLIEDTLQHLIDKIDEKKADIIIGGYQRVTQEGKIKRKVKLKQTEWAKYQIVAPWAKIYRTKFLKDNNVKFMQNVLGEDIYFMMREYVHHPKVIISDLICYNWTDNEVSVSNTIHKKISNETSLIKLYNQIEDISGINSMKENKMHEYFLLKTAVWDILYTVLRNPYEEVIRNDKEIWDWMEQHYPEYSKNPYLTFSRPKGENIWIRVIVCIYIKSLNTRAHNWVIKIISKNNK